MTIYVKSSQIYRGRVVGDNNAESIDVVRDVASNRLARAPTLSSPFFFL
jgi:hypothetical protein